MMLSNGIREIADIVGGGSRPYEPVSAALYDKL